MACGTGALTRAFADATPPPARLVGADYTAEMLNVARAWDDGESARRAHPAARPEYILADAMALPFADASFDVVSIAFGIRNVADPARALAEFRRVLRPGGRLVILEFSRPRAPVLGLLNDLYCRRIMPLTATLIARDRSGAYRYLPKSVAAFASREEMADAIRRAGFTDVTMTALTFGVCVAYRGLAAPARR